MTSDPAVLSRLHLLITCQHHHVPHSSQFFRIIRRFPHGEGICSLLRIKANISQHALGPRGTSTVT